MKIAGSMLDLIGNIPLVRLNRIGIEKEVEILVKPEFLNPSGSIKDRIAKFMVEAAEQEGKLHPGSMIVEASTGNTGTALAFVAAVKGYKRMVFSPQKVSNPQRSAIMRAYGCEINKVDTSATEAQSRGQDNSIHGAVVEVLPRQLCLQMERENEDVWWARQFSNPNNVRAHRDWTAREILDQTDGRLDAFVASVGTGGTLLGVAQALKAHDPAILIAAVEPAAAPRLARAKSDYPMIEGITDGIIPDIFDSGLLDEVFTVTNEEAIEMAHRLAQEEGIFCGMSSGANVLACTQLAEKLGPGKRIVTILPDSRDRYLEVEQYTT